MSILNDIYNADKVIEELKNIRSPEDLQFTIQNAKDIFDKYATDVKGVVSELERWQDMAKDIGILSEGADYVNQAQDILLNTAIDLTKGSCLEGKLGLENLLLSKNKPLSKETSYFAIGGVKIDYVFRPQSEYETETSSQPIISSSNIDRLSENAENKNPTLRIRCILKGEDRETRFKQINQIRENKQIIKVVINEVFDRMIITRLKPNYDNSTNSLEFSIDLENVFIAQLKRSAVRRNESIKKSKNVKPNLEIPNTIYNVDNVLTELERPNLQRIEKSKALQDMIKPEKRKTGITTPIKLKEDSRYGDRASRRNIRKKWRGGR